MIKGEIKIKPEVLIALIKLSGFDKEEISKKLKIPFQRIDEGKLTFSQLKSLAQTLKRPIVAFFSDEISAPQYIPDYRLDRRRKINPEVLLAQRKLNYLIEKLRELGTTKSNIPEFSSQISAMELAEKFRNHLSIDLIKNQKPEFILENYKNKIEEKLNLIIIEYPLKPSKRREKEISDDVRAFSVYYPDISGIVLNENDHPSVKLFSLFHEVCHILRKNSGICSLEYEVEKEFEEESYCNSFAAEFLVPAKDLKEELQKFGSANILSITEEVSKIYGVSKQVVLLRLLYIKYINQEKYYELKKALEEKKKEKTKIGYKDWNKVFKNRTGNVVIEGVKEALNKGKVSFYEALNILDMKSKYAEKLLYAK